MQRCLLGRLLVLLALTCSPNQFSHLRTQPSEWRWTGSPRLLQLVISSHLLDRATGTLRRDSASIARSR